MGKHVVCPLAEDRDLRDTYADLISQWEFDHNAFTNMTMYFWAAQWNYYAALAFCKLSILLQYLRIFPQINFRRACYAMIAITIIWGLWSTLTALFMCVPVPIFWQVVQFTNPQCLPRLIVWYIHPINTSINVLSVADCASRYTNAAINIVSDCAIFLLPVGVINSLEIPRRQKNLLLAVFTMGLV